MERQVLERMLADGLSLEEIGRRLGRHHSTVSYWLTQHGLSSAHSEHAPRGGIDEATLRKLCAAGLSIREIASETAFSYSSVRYWLRRYGLSSETSQKRLPVRQARAAGVRRLELVCRRHGRTDFVLEGRSYYRCARCRMDRVAARRKALKAIMVERAGGRCSLCGYDRAPGALHFHHLDPATKEFALGQRGLTRALKRVQAEADKCVLLCANCHAEVEAGLSEVF